MGQNLTTQYLNMTEEVADTRFSYRTGWPRLPVLPLQTSFLHGTGPLGQEDVRETVVPYFVNIGQNIARILIANGVRIENIHLCYRYNRGIPESVRRPTFLCYSDIQKAGQEIEKWRRAVRQVVGMFKWRGLNNVAIEIADHRVEQEIRTDVVDSEEAIDAWRDFAPRIQQYIAKHEYVTMDVVRRFWIGAKEDAKATVVISAKDANDSSWDDTLSLLRETLPSFFDVELIYLNTIHGIA